MSCSGGYKNEPDESALALEYAALAPLPLEAIKVAIIQLKRVLKYRITAADVWEMVQGGDPESRALVAWSLLRDDLKRYRARDSIACSDPITLWAIKNCGGWYELCYMESEKAVNLFTRFYVAGIKQGIGKNDVPDHLPGDDETKAKNGYCINAQWDGEIKQLDTRGGGNVARITV